MKTAIITVSSRVLFLLAIGGLACNPHEGEQTAGSTAVGSTTAGSTGDPAEWEPGAWIGHWHFFGVSHATGLEIYDLELRADGTAIQKRLSCGGGEKVSVTTRWTDSLGVLQIIPPPGAAVMSWLNNNEVSTVIFTPGTDCNELIAQAWDGDIRQAQAPFQRGERCIDDTICESVAGLLWCSGEPPPEC